ncbi:MAG TPA: amidohydrolase [Thermoanaerobaculia bacterium]
MSGAAVTSAATLILTNGRIWTGDPSRRFVEAVAIQGNRIVLTGATEEVLRFAPGAEQLDLQGRLAVPGFIDNHVHFVDGGFQLSRVQLRDAASAEVFAQRIAAHAQQLGKGAWITGGEWDEQAWQPARLPSKELIDATTPDNPVFVARLDQHMALANTVALKLAGITRETPDPPGGPIVKDAYGEPTGLLKDAAMSAVYAVIPSPSMEERVAAAQAGLAHAATVGVTSFCDMSGAQAYEDFRAYQRLDREGKLTSRVYLFTPIAAFRRLVDAGVEKRFGSERLRIGGLKGFSDGSLGSSTACFHEPFVGEPENRGLAMKELTEGSLAKWAREADAHDLQVALHAIGDRANDEVLKIYESLPRFRERRFRVEHAQHLSPSLVKRFAEGRVVASMQPYHAIDDGRWAEQKVGRERARSMYAFRSLLDAGAVLTFGSDWTVAPLSPLAGIHAAVTRATIDGRNPEGWIPEEKITVEEALRCYTVNNAWAMFAEHEVGRIAPGLLADIVVLSQDLFEVPPSEIATARVDVTVFDGRVVHTGKR